MSLVEHTASGFDYGSRHGEQAGRPSQTTLDPVLRRMERTAFMGEAERHLVHALTGPAVAHRLGADLGDDGDSRCRFLVSGWACRVCDTPWGARQILDFVLPGDPIGVTLSPKLDGLYRVIAITRGATVDASALRDRMRAEADAYPQIRGACAAEDRVATARMMSHITRLGAPTATQGLVHLLLELRARMAQIGMLEDERFPMPLSQENLHEALGITVTQVYRILTQLRRDGLIRMGPGWTEIANPAALAAAAGLDGWRP
jgi:CRP-like cAMP-binding protein